MKWLTARVGDQHYRVFRGMLLVAFFVLAGRIAGAIKEILLAWRYGIGSEVDVYVFALVLVTWLPSIAASVLNSALVPLINRTESVQRREFLSELTGATILVAIGVLFFLLFVAPLIVPALASGLPHSSQASLADVVRYLAPAGALKLFISLFSAQLLAQERHANTLMEAVPALALCAFIYFWPGSFDYQPLVWGTLIGIVLQCFALYYLLKRSVAKPSLVFGFNSPAWEGFFSAFLTLSIGTVIMSLIILIDQVLASRVGDGSVATMNYAARLLALALGLGGTAIARAILPVLSDRHLTTQQRAKLARQWSKVLLLVGLMAAMLAWLAGPAVVSLMFERGAFSADDSLKVSGVFQVAALQLPFFFSGIVLVQFFASIGRYKVIAVSSVLAVSVKLLIGPFLISWLGLKGLAISTILVYVASFCFFSLMIRKE